MCPDWIFPRSEVDNVSSFVHMHKFAARIMRGNEIRKLPEANFPRSKLQEINQEEGNQNKSVRIIRTDIAW